MSRYIKSELYRLLRVKGTYLFVIISAVLLLSSNIILACVKLSDRSFPYATTQFALSNVMTGMIFVLFLCIMVSNIVFSNEYSNHTMKNSVTFGITRSTLYFGKFITQVIYAMVAFILIIGLHVLSSYLLLENSGADSLIMLLRICLICLPLFFFALGVTNCFAFLFEGSGATISSSFGIMLALPLISNLLGMKFMVFKKLAEVMPYNMINSIKFNFKENKFDTIWGANGFTYYWIIGIVEMILFVVWGYLFFRKREIK